MLLLFTFLLALGLFFSIGLLKVYKNESAKELKRQARKGDQTAKLLYRVVAFGLDVDIFLWAIIALVGGGLFVAINSQLPIFIAFILVASIVWFSFAYLPISHSSRYMLIAAKYCSPVLNWLLDRLQPVLRRANYHTSKRLPQTKHSGMYEKEDLISLLETQRKQVDNRITKEELSIAKNALQFGEKKVSDVMTPKRMIKMVSTHDMIGPVLMDELHKTGHSRFPVKHDSPDNIVGTLYIRDLVNAKAGGFVKDIMRKDVFYVNEEQELARVLDAFIKTKHHLFLVVNKFEEVVGVISVEDIIEQVLGRQIIDEFDSYDNMREVAKMEAEKASQEHQNVLKSNQEKPKTKEENAEDYKQRYR